MTRFVIRYIVLFWTIITMGIFLANLMGQNNPQPMLAFTSDRIGTNQIYLHDSSTRNVRQVTHNTYESFQPVWESNQSLGYVSYPSPLHVLIMDISRGSIAPLDTNVAENQYEPDWSQDEHVAVAANPNIDWDILLYEPSKKPYSAIFNSADNELEPCWWKNHNLSFVSDRGGDQDIYLYDLSSEVLTNLTDDPANDYNPACSTDGRLAFTSTRDFNAEVYVMDLKTGITQNVTKNPASDFNPAWLPDGQLSFVSDRDGNREIYVLNMNTGELNNITQNSANDDQPAWSTR